MRLGRLLPQKWYERDALEVAPELLGCLLCREEVVLRITEVEAYRWPDDTACHARFGRTERNAPMWGRGGVAYVYLCYGIHQMLNIVTNPRGQASAVLVRACEPVAGFDVIRERRGGMDGPASLAGPGKVAAALAIDTSWSHHPLFKRGGLELREGSPPASMLVSPRVGIDYAIPEHRDAPWRFASGATKWVSVRKTLRPR